MRNDKLLGDLHLQLFLFEAHMHNSNSLLIRFAVCVQAVEDILRQSTERVIQQILLEEVILELATTHQVSLQDQKVSLTTLRPVQIGFQCPEEGRANDSRILECFLKEELCQW